MARHRRRCDGPGHLQQAAQARGDARGGVASVQREALPRGGQDRHREGDGRRGEGAGQAERQRRFGVGQVRRRAGLPSVAAVRAGSHECRRQVVDERRVGRGRILLGHASKALERAQAARSTSRRCGRPRGRKGANDLLGRACTLRVAMTPRG